MCMDMKWRQVSCIQIARGDTRSVYPTTKESTQSVQLGSFLVTVILTVITHKGRRQRPYPRE